MTNERMRFTTNAERDTYVALKMLGLEVEYYGQALLNEQARAMLRGVPTPQRWVPDFMVSRPPITDRPRYPDALRGKYTFLVDAKWRWKNTGNHSIEMRSLLAAPTFGLDVFYVCSTREGSECRDFGVISYEHAKRTRHRPCCAACYRTFAQTRDPMRDLPEHCPNQERSREASATPYVVFPATELFPLKGGVFDRTGPSQLAKLGPPYGFRESA